MAARARVCSEEEIRLRQHFLKTYFSLSLSLTRMFLEAGKHVLVEYPMTLSAGTARELWEMAEQKGDDTSPQRCKLAFYNDIQSRLLWCSA